MAERPTQETIDQMHNWFAVECNNRAWGLASAESRGVEEGREMLFAAYASAYHWSQVGAPVNMARADVMLAHVHSVLGEGVQALQCARRSLTFFVDNNVGADWDVAFAHLEMAFAASVLGDTELHASHYAEAKQRGDAIQDAEDRKVFLDEFAKIPAPVSAG